MNATRRMFLRGAGGAVLAIPFLPSISPGASQAATANRLKFIQVSCEWLLPRAFTIPGYFDDRTAEYYPEEAVPWTTLDADTQSQRLAEIVGRNGRLSYVLDERWNPYVDRMNVISNNHGFVTSPLHNSTISSTCSGQHDDTFEPVYPYSSDWLIEQAIYQGAAPPIPNLRINLLTPTTGGSKVHRAYSFGVEGGQRKEYTGVEDLPALLSLLSNAARPSDESQAAAAARAERTMAYERALDDVLEDYHRLSAHPRLGATDRARLEQTADLWADVQRSLGETPMVSCGDFGTVGDGNSRQLHERGMDLAVAALACGLTRIVNYTIKPVADNDHPDKHALHGTAHDSRTRVNDQGFEEFARWRGHRVVDLLDRLSGQLDEHGEPLLDSCLLQWTHEYGNYGHPRLGYTSIIAGGAGGAMDLGQHIDAGGAPINRLHITSMIAMGLDIADIERDGYVGFGEYNPQDDDDSEILHYRGDWRNNPRRYNYENASRFLSDAEKRKPFPYLR